LIGKCAAVVSAFAGNCRTFRCHTFPHPNKTEAIVTESSIQSAHARQLGEGVERAVMQGAQAVSVLAVVVMLVIAGVTLVDVISRWLLNTSIAAMNEIVSVGFAIAVAATLPAGVAMRSNLRVNLLEELMSPRTRAWLNVVGSVLLVGFFLLLAWRMQVLGETMSARNRTTTIMKLPIGPVYMAVGALAALAALAQAVLTVLDILRIPDAVSMAKGAQRTSPMAAVVLAVTGLVSAGVVVMWLFYPSVLQGFVRANPVLSVTLGFGLLWLLMLAMVPVAVTMLLIGMLGCMMFLSTNAALTVFSSEAASFLTNPLVATLPLFLLMGAFAAVGGLADDVYKLAHAVFARLRGGLALATIGGCAGFGAVTGSSLATTAVFGSIAIPQMQAKGYSPGLSTGSVAAGGTLGALIPPSAPLILFALLTETSIGALFIAAMIPGLIAVALYLLAIMYTVWRDPKAAPIMETRERGARRKALMGAGPVLLLFGLVLGGLYAGVFTATESAAVGAILAFLIALLRGRLNLRALLEVMGGITKMTAMIYGLIFGALTFSYMVGLSQMPDILTRAIGGLDLAPLLVIALLILAYLALGCVMDSFAVMVITVPVVTPLILGLGYTGMPGLELVWFGILMLVIIETGLITPPFGINLFVMKSLQPNISLMTIYRGAMPFVVMDLIKIVILVLFPVLTLWLPAQM
jgi:C4-dicarboxylate transporter, DctM subunit